MTQIWRKGDRIRLLVPTIGGWQGEAILTEDEMPECEDDLVYWRRAEDDDPEREDGCCIKAEVEWICSGDEAHLSPAARAVLDAACDSLDRRGYISDQVAAALRAVADEVLPLPRLPFDSCCEIRSAGERVELLAIAAELETNAQ